ncbi:MAG: hypothetical protein AAF431_06225 [Pseudomonadota bacterium]
MSKPGKNAFEPIQFLEFWRLVAIDLGNSRLRINTNAKSIHELVDKDGDSRSYLVDAIRKSYKLSQCQHLASPISLEHVLDILGETAYTLQGDQRDDLFDIELLEEIAWHISDRYSIQLSTLVEQHDKPAANNKSAQIVSFPNYKIRRANNHRL